MARLPGVILAAVLAAAGLRAGEPRGLHTHPEAWRMHPLPAGLGLDDEPAPDGPEDDVRACRRVSYRIAKALVQHALDCGGWFQSIDQTVVELLVEEGYLDGIPVDPADGPVSFSNYVLSLSRREGPEVWSIGCYKHRGSTVEMRFPTRPGAPSGPVPRPTPAGP